MQHTVMMIGGGGREHALTRHVARSEHVARILAFGTNTGIASEPKVEVLDEKQPDVESLADIAEREGVTLTLVGPEQPLVEGIVDVFRARGLAIVGPTKDAAQLEASKAFAKEVMKSAGVPTAEATRHESLDDARAELERRGVPTVVKYDGLAGGKGVRVCHTREEAEEFLSELYEKDATAPVLLEDYLAPHPTWPRAELSVIALVDAHGGLVVFPAAQDYKPIFDNDEGPNTGGMGSFAPHPGVDEQLMREIEKEIFTPTIKEMKKRGTPFSGILYAGLMVTEDGVKVVEFNVRFGDPEAQPLVELVKSDLVPVFAKLAAGEHIEQSDVTLHDGAAAAVVIAQEGYPGSVGECVIPERLLGPHTYCAGTAPGKSGEVRATGGRVCAVTMRAADIAQARADCYALLGEQPPGLYWRSDIAQGY